MSTPGRPQRGIQSIEVGGALLRALAHHGRPMALKDLAHAAGMPAAKAHPYLVSFGKLGLIGQEGASGRYGLGPLALQLGLISLQQYDPIRLASARIAELAQALGHTTAVAVWGSRGPTMVRVEEAPTPVHVHMRHGTVMSIRRTATGRLFAAYLPEQEVRAALAAEAAWGRETGVSGAGPARIDAELRAVMEQVRRDGVATIVDGAAPGVSAVAAPVFDGAGRLLLAITVIGPSASLDLGPQGSVVAAMRQAAQDLSATAGAVASAV
ncbi:MAG: IclR family transcriptional regulator [Aquabacterium sp.]